jgi:chromosomal replication initiation ATPase DnaA
VASVEQHVGMVDHREPLRIPRASLDQYLAVVSRHLELAASAIRSSARLHRLAQARRLFSFLACRYGGHPVKDAARFLGVDPSGVTNALRSCDHRLSTDPEFAAEVEAIVRASQERFRKFRNV